jgi:hypothetical protein
VSDEPSNTASEWLGNFLRFLNEHESPPNLQSSLTDDFTYEDRRSGPSFPNLDAETFPRFIESTWETGAGRPQWTVQIVAVRGEQFAAGVMNLDYGNGMVREAILVIGLDATLRLMHCNIQFDVDDVDRAIAELDRLHSQAGISN